MSAVVGLLEFLLAHLPLVEFLQEAIGSGKLSKERALAALRAEIGKASDAEIDREFPLGRG